VVLSRAALLAAILVAAACGTAEKAAAPDPIERHLVYQKLVGKKGIWVADADGSNPRLLVSTGFAPEISPNGAWVAYLAECTEATGRCSLHIVPTSGGNAREVAGGIYADFGWSPDSERIAAEQASLPANLALVSIDVASGDKAVLTEGQLWGWSFSPDGSQIVFARTENPTEFNERAAPVLGNESNLFVIDVEGGEAKRITDTGDAAEPVWGPKAIAFAKLVSCITPEAPPDPPANCRNNTWGAHEIWQIQPDGSGRRTITGPLPDRLQAQGFTGLTPVDWSDDGRALLSCWANEWGCVPMAVDPASGKERELDNAQGSEPVALSQDGQFALVETGGGGEPSPEDYVVLIFPYEGGKPEVVARAAVSPSWNR
jgi:Tol biopolymer transport system component